MKTETGLLNIRLAELLKFHLPKTFFCSYRVCFRVLSFLHDLLLVCFLAS